MSNDIQQRIEALEARIQALEARIEQLEQQQQAAGRERSQDAKDWFERIN